MVSKHKQDPHYEEDLNAYLAYREGAEARGEDVPIPSTWIIRRQKARKLAIDTGVMLPSENALTFEIDKAEKERDRLREAGEKAQEHYELLVSMKNKLYPEAKS